MFISVSFSVFRFRLFPPAPLLGCPYMDREIKTFWFFDKPSLAQLRSEKKRSSFFKSPYTAQRAGRIWSKIKSKVLSSLHIYIWTFQWVFLQYHTKFLNDYFSRMRALFKSLSETENPLEGAGGSPPSAGSWSSARRVGQNNEKENREFLRQKEQQKESKGGWKLPVSKAPMGDEAINLWRKR